MQPDRWNKIQRLLLLATERQPPERAAFLDQACAGDESLRKEIDSLLTYESEARDFLVAPDLHEVARSPVQPHPSGVPGDEAGHPFLPDIISHYRLGSKLGGGGMGVVYQAEDLRLGRTVALKFLPERMAGDEVAVKRLRQEARAASSLNHPNICTIHDIDQDQGRLFIVMEKLEGCTLAERIGDSPMLPGELLDLATQITSALATAHAKGIAHRDLKLSNIFVTLEGKAKLLDFGLARQLPQTFDQADLLITGDESFTRPGAVVGTPSFMSPEQAACQPLDARTDLFSLGVVLYKMATGVLPFPGKTVGEVLGAIRQGTPAPPHSLNPEIPAGLEAIIVKALEKDRNLRYQTAAEINRDLLQLGRSLNLFANVGRSVRDAFLESRLVQAIAVLIALCVLCAPVAWIYRNDIRRGLGLTLPLPDQKSLVILPFRAIPGDPKSLAFADGVTETITAKLTQLTLSNFLQVAPTTEVRTRKVADAEDARRELGANLVLEGTLQFSGNEGRATFALIDTRSHLQLRGDAITAKADNAFVFQDRIVDSVLRILELQLGPAQRGRLSAVGSGNPDAYGFYVQATGYLYGYQANSVDNAILLFKRAVDLDSNFADALAGLGQAYWIKSGAGKDQALADAARKACENAVTLSPSSAPAHICLGTLHNETGQYEQAVADFRKAAEIERSSDAAYRGLGRAYERLNDFHSAEETYLRAIEVRPHYWAGYQWLGHFYMYQAKYRDAVVRYRQAADLTPDNNQPLLGLGSAYYFSGQFSDAISTLNRANEIRPTAAGYHDLGTVYLALRQYDQATRSLERAVQLDSSNHIIAGHLAKAYYWSPGGRARGIAAYGDAIRLADRKLMINPRDADVHILMARYCAFADQKEEALTHLQTALGLRSNDSEYACIAAVIYSRLGNRSAALQWLERSIRGGYSTAEIQSDPDLDIMRNDPEFLRLLK